jgi:hypothetical protein
VRHVVQQDQQILPASLVQQDDALVSLKFGQEWVSTTVDSLPASTFPPTGQIFPVTMAFEDPEASQQLYVPTTVPIWEDATGLEQATQALMKTQPAWPPYQLSMNQPTRYNYSPVSNSPAVYTTTTSWQVQPSPPIWQSLTRLKPPATALDHILVSIIEAQKQIPSDVNTTQRHL